MKNLEMVVAFSSLEVAKVTEVYIILFSLLSATFVIALSPSFSKK